MVRIALAQLPFEHIRSFGISLFEKNSPKIMLLRDKRYGLIIADP